MTAQETSGIAGLPHGGFHDHPVLAKNFHNLRQLWHRTDLQRHAAQEQKQQATHQQTTHPTSNKEQRTIRRWHIIMNDKGRNNKQQTTQKQQTIIKQTQSVKLARKEKITHNNQPTEKNNNKQTINQTIKPTRFI